MNKFFDVAGKVVVITGGGGILCSTMAKALAKSGAKVAVLDLVQSAAEKVVKEITADKGQAIAIQCDVLDKKSLQKAKEQINSKLGTIDILINGAGGNKKEATTTPDLSFFDLPSDAIRFVFDLNFIGSFLPAQVFAKDMVEKDAGVILNISSMNAIRPLTRIPAY